MNRRRQTSGNTLVEVVVSTILVGALLTASLNAVGQSLLGQRKAADRIAARLLAETLLTEIMQKAYLDPAGGAPPLGLDAGEAGTNRLAYDDVDDYHGLALSPPQAKDGVAIPGFTGWTSSVTVAWVSPTTLAPAATDTGAKRITVVITLQSTTLCSLSSFKTSAP